MSENSNLKVKAPGAKHRLIETAIRLFGDSGIRATGIDTLLAEAGVAKMSLYAHFKSKDELVVAVIDELSERLLTAFAGVCQGLGTDASKKVDQIFLAIEGKVNSDNFHGCEFIRAMSEFPDPQSPVNMAVVRHRSRLRTFLQTLLEDGGIANPKEIASELSVLIDGSLVDGHATGKPDAAIASRRIAQTLLSKKL